MSGNSKTPTNWQSFVRDTNNKTELFSFLAEIISQTPVVNTVISTKGPSIVSNKETSKDNLDPCSHEEADTRTFVHARHAAIDGSKALIINANDKDIVVIAVSVMALIQDEGLEKKLDLLWTGQKYYVDTHT